MSDAMAIALVTATIKSMLSSAVNDHNLSTVLGRAVNVTSVAPNLVKEGDSEPPTLDLFLYHVIPNAGWRNVGLPSRDGNGSRLASPPLAIDLFYLLTAYGSADLDTETILGHAMQIIHEMPVLTRDMIKNVLSSQLNVTADMKNALSASGLADQIELVKIVPYSMSQEEASKLWSAILTGYRPSVAYKVSVVLIESRSPARSPLPVLSVSIGRNRSGVAAQPYPLPPLPIITEVELPDSQTKVRLGDPLAVKGSYLHYDGTALLRFSHARLKVTADITSLDKRLEDEIDVTLPDDAAAEAAWAPGVYTVSAIFGTGKDEIASNETALALAPIIKAIDASDKANIKVTVSPQVRPGQSASLIIGDRDISAKSFQSQTGSIFFDASTVPAGSYMAYIRIDGIDSIFINMDSVPPAFDPILNKKVNLP